MSSVSPIRDGVAAALLEVSALTKIYAQRRTFGRKLPQVTAVKDAHLQILKGETMGIVGVSGSGKSTLARCIAGLETPTSGSVRFSSRDLQSLDRHERRWFHRNVQLVLQDSATALNPRFTAAEIIAEPLRICKLGTAVERRDCTLDLLQQLELPAMLAERRPQQLSGGQRQRLSIARALALKPTLLILDEVLTGLDVPVQKHILELLSRLSRQHSFTCLFVSHDLRLMRAITDRITVMHEGHIVEQGATLELFATSQEAHTRELLNTITGRAALQGVAAGGY